MPSREKQDQVVAACIAAARVCEGTGAANEMIAARATLIVYACRT